MLSDTVFTDVTARATRYTYDTFERLSTVGDTLGIWTTRYETKRGVADTLITPYADTVIYTFDARGRTLGPTIRSGTNPVQTTAPVWNVGLALDSLTRKIGATLGGRYLRTGAWGEDGPAVGPTWVDAWGSSWADSLVYDGLNRLAVRVLRKDGIVFSRDTFNFDPNSNLKTPGGGESYDRFDKLLTRAGAGCTWTYTYDAGGNLTQAACGAGTRWAYVYDPLDRLVADSLNGTLIARYGYDLLGRRIVKNVYSASSGGQVGYTRFVYHGDQVAYEATQTGRVTLRYTWGRASDDLLAIRDSLGNHLYVVQDRLRSIRAVFTRAGTWQLNLGYGTYGARNDSTGTLPFELRYRWTGREYDAETGLYYFRARYYDPGARRFTQEDPAGYGGSANLYRYVDGDPLEARDPSGLGKDYEYFGGNPADWSNVPGFNSNGSRQATGGSGIARINHSDYLEDDSYGDDLLTVIAAAQNGRAICSGDVCGVRGVQVIVWGQRDALPNDEGTYSGKNSNVFGHVTVLVNKELFDFDEPGMLHEDRKELISAFMSAYESVRAGTGYNLKLTDEQISSVRESLMGDQGTFDQPFNNCTMPIQRALGSIGYHTGGVPTPQELVHELYSLNLVASITVYPHH